MKILVTYGSERGGTAGIAERIASTLRARGADVELESAERVKDVRAYDAVVLGGALYAFRWHAHARRVVLRHAKALGEREVWVFSSGPLDDSASRRAIEPIPEVQRLMDYVGARGHVTFGGRLEADAKGFPASEIAKKSAGDYRDFARIEAWANEVGVALEAPARPRPTPTPLPSRTLPLVLALVSGSGALVLAAMLAAGAWIGALSLALLVGAPLLATAWAHYARSDYAAFASLVAGLALGVAAVVALATGAPPWIGGIGLALALAVIADGAARSAKIIAEWQQLAKSMGPPPEHGPRTTPRAA